MSQNNSLNGALGVYWEADYRSGRCPQCNGLLDQVEKEHSPSRFCKKCSGYVLGELIVKQITIKPPTPPMCAKFSCILKYSKDLLTYTLINLYHTKRVKYAIDNRNKKILERYRTGSPSPMTLWQAIHANIKLKCPICRKYNVDPLLFSRR
jgi:hypothetical protein